ncbi:DUF5753 domain-containing protein [Streptomyces sp. NPDC056405]|uniref:DUF5753 domain-containing protein n=1 Tax=Streptomyces sp. NPDC056405 TaxID=3345811 RepID=UPI0035D8C880
MHREDQPEGAATDVPGLLQTPDYARAVFGYMVPDLPGSELTPRVEHRLRRRAVVDRDIPVPYETIVHEAALRIRVGDCRVTLTQLRRILDEMERGHFTVLVVRFDTDHFAGAGAAMMHVGGPLPRLDTVLRDSPSGTAFLDAESQLERFRTLFRKMEKAALDPTRTRDFIHHLAKEL